MGARQGEAPPKCPHQGKYGESPMPGDVEMQGLEENALKLLSCRLCHIKVAKISRMCQSAGIGFFAITNNKKNC